MLLQEPLMKTAKKSASAVVNVNVDLEASVRGSGDIAHIGHSVLDSSTSGSGLISCC